MSALHDWHREVFCKRTTTTLVFPAYTTNLGNSFPETRHDVELATARSVVVQRALNEMTPDEWSLAQRVFDATDEGQALKDAHAGVRREHCELWLKHLLYETEHPELVPHSELALQKVLAHHAHPGRVTGHRARLVAALHGAHAAAKVAKEAVDLAETLIVDTGSES